MYFKQNALALSQERRSQAAYEAVNDATASTEVAFYETEASRPEAPDYTLGFRDILLHSRQGALAEARSLCDNDTMFHPGLRSNHIVLGIGLGYVLDEAFKRSTGRIFIYEPNVDLLRFVLENVDLSHHFASQRVYLASTLMELFAQLKSRYLVGDAIDILVTQGYAALMAAKIPTLMEKLVDFVKEKKENMSVGLSFHLDWVEHLIHNIRYFSQTPMLSHEFHHYFEEKPALVISSGPSLDEAIPAILAHRDACILYAVGGALRPLLNAGITPDFTVFLDFLGPKEQLHGLGEATKDITFLCSAFADPACFEAPAKARYILPFANYTGFSNWLDKVYESSAPRFGSGATVSITAFECARLMGCNPLILVGQDLALRGRQYYAGGVEASIDEEGFATLEASEQMAGRRIKLSEVPGQNGETLLSPPDYIAYRQHLMELAEGIHAKSGQKSDTPATRLFNASAGGALIPGFEHDALGNILWQLSPSPLDKTLPPKEASQWCEPSRLVAEAQKLRNAFMAAASQADSVLKALGPILEKTASLEKTKPNIRSSDASAYHQERQKFSELLNENGILDYCLTSEVWALQEKFNFDPKNSEDVWQNMQADWQYFSNSKRLIEEKLLPWIDTTLEAISIKN
ncbi:MAG: 6-hydroxymethylpterin diphosphokinase MptE-like protein [Vampirovibrionales bacterium]|nr:6-hydroxymethylpterin diphosphokinase MptE-like protein [Vampirovibrionales bacterium]